MNGTTPVHPGHRAALLAVGSTLLLAATVRAQRPAPPPTPDPRLEEAVRWYTGIAGHVDDDRARALPIEVARGGDPVARMWVARCHSRGRMGFAEDTARAGEIARGAIDDIRLWAGLGVVEAAFLLGSAHDEALGVDEDPALAAAWLHRAADQGHVLAQHNLGNAYFAGRGVPRSDALAFYWWRRAATAGDAIAQLRLATMYEEGDGVPADREAAIRWYREAAARGSAEARDALDRLEGTTGSTR